ncbi:MAG: sulfotransferase [Solirubrobacteraceae bacterium]
MPAAGRPKVLFIGGYSRSGSTLLDCMLGQLPGVFSTGELSYIWTRGLSENRLCGCGERFLDCPFWTRVGELGFGGWKRVDASSMIALERAVNRHRYLPFLLAPRLKPGFRRDLRRYADVLARLYGAIQQASQARLIVDSTIDPAYGFILRRVEGVDLRLVHMVRDSRATAFSWTRLRRVPDRGDGVAYQRTLHPARVATRWTLYHLLIHLLARAGFSEMRVLYERVADSPEEEIRRIMRHIDEPLAGAELDFIGPGEVTLGTNHTAAGNRMRLRRGTIPVRLDDEWATAMRPVHRRLVTVLTWPLLRSYGYPGKAPRPTAGARTG